MSNNPSSSALIELLDKFVRKCCANELTEGNAASIQELAAAESNEKVLAQIAADAWDRYSVVDVELVIAILRRWLEVEPDSLEAKRTLGSYLLSHGPDWDAEGNALIAEFERDKTKQSGSS